MIFKNYIISTQKMPIPLEGDFQIPQLSVINAKREANFPSKNRQKQSFKNRGKQSPLYELLQKTFKAKQWGVQFTLLFFYLFFSSLCFRYQSMLPKMYACIAFLHFIHAIQFSQFPFFHSNEF